MKKTFIPRSHRPRVIGGEISPKKNPTAFTFTNTESIQKKIVCICVEEDAHAATTLKKQSKEDVLILYLDELGSTWHFSFFEGIVTFYTQENTIQPLGIYHRLGYPKGDNFDKQLLINLCEAVHQSNCPFVGTHHENFFNISKIFQLNKSIHPSLLETKVEGLSTPTSYFIKGDPSFLNKIKHDHSKIIVKSCSSTRSKVVDQTVFLKWTKRNIHSIPTLFQEKAEGEDLRIHVLGDNVFGIKMLNKDAVDYRYSKKKLLFESIPISSELSDFCKKVVGKEKLFLGGIDFVSSSKGTVCLECNPAPGWSWYKSNDFIHSMSHQLIKHLH